MRVALDAMGGDRAPGEVVRGAILAVERLDLQVWLVGPTEKVERELAGAGYRGDRIQVIQAAEVVAMGAHGAEAVQRDRHRRATSILVATDLVRRGEARAVVSAGSTGAQLAAAQLSLRRMKGVHRAAIASPFPTLEGISVLIDAGANPDCDARDLLTFAVMGSIYASEVLGIANPRVGLLSNGAEETKGNTLVMEAHRLLVRSGLNFIGNVEGRDLLTGAVDVTVCDGFTGNVVLKVAEGIGTGVFHMMKAELRDLRSKLGAALLKPALRRVKGRMDYSEYGGAPLLGVRGVSIIAHGSSDRKAIYNAVRVAAEAVEKDVVGRIERALTTHGLVEAGAAKDESREDATE
ncbi:MAG: phosphate acyltransferase PlsX [Bacillota bacterium]|nr:phosphate acyltransferase PlsX [Bacillota bacterium]